LKDSNFFDIKPYDSEPWLSPCGRGIPYYPAEAAGQCQDAPSLPFDYENLRDTQWISQRPFTDCKSGDQER